MEYLPSSPQQVVNSLATDFADEFPHLVESASLFYWSGFHELVGRSMSSEPRPRSTQTFPASFLGQGEPLYLVKLFAGLTWSPSWLGLAHPCGQQTPCVDNLTHLSRFGASHDDGTAFIMEENCLLVWCTAQGRFRDCLRDVVQRGLDRIQDDLSEYSKADADAAPADVLGPITLDFDNGHSNAFNMSDFFEADGLAGVGLTGTSSVHGTPVGDSSPFIRIVSPLAHGCDFLLSSPPDPNFWLSPSKAYMSPGTFSPPCVDPRLISPSMFPLEDVVESTPSVSSSPLSSGSSAAGDELSDIGTPYSVASPLPSPKRKRADDDEEGARMAPKLSPSPSHLLEPPPAKSPRIQAKRASPPSRKAPAAYKSSKKQRFVCECGKSYSRDKDRERHQETSCVLMEVKPTVVCDVCHDVLGARPDALLRHQNSARCNPTKRLKAIA
ncbi:hypothetical protein PENSPDRAFT_689181 [Peniophora sp. CONT]|nr:hypothetical protein PENSPDRAFT_689181 [Peniophora sp. CONT]